MVDENRIGKDGKMLKSERNAWSRNTPENRWPPLMTRFLEDDRADNKNLVRTSGTHDCRFPPSRRC